MKRDSIPACDILEYMKNFSSQTQIIGEKGENICASLLKQLGFTIKERNFTVRGGEIDIVAFKNEILHFIEVKSIQCNNANVSYETVYNPAENFNKHKIRKFKNACLHYVRKYNVSYETQIDLYIVYIDKSNKKHRIKRIKNIL